MATEKDCVDAKIQDLYKTEYLLGCIETFRAFPVNISKNYRIKEVRTAQRVQPLGYGLSTEESAFDST
jgi:hypothetical protein